MKFRFKTLLISIFLIAGVWNSIYASHISGGDFTYECVGQDSFLVTYNMYRDCAGINAPSSITVNVTDTCGNYFTQVLTQQSSFEVSQICAFDYGNTNCNGGAINGQEQYIYKGLVVLSSSCNSWTIDWSNCCRNSLISSLANSLNMGYYISVTIQTGVDSVNNSPSFSLPPIPNVCLNQPISFNLGVIEPDGDSLVYSFSPGLEGKNQPVTYLSPYSYQIPLPDTNLTLDSLTGVIRFTPTSIGVYLVVLKIEEYDKVTGMVKGESFRDFQVFVSNCSSNDPEVDTPGVTNFNGEGSRIDSNTIAVCGGDVFSFDLEFYDQDTLDTLSISHNILEAFDNSAIVSVSGVNPIVVTVNCIAPTVSTRVIPISFLIKDDGCPIMGTTRMQVNIEVTQKTKAIGDHIICENSWTNLSASGGTIFNWSVISGSPIDTVANSPSYNMSCTSCQKSMVSPQVTTTYLVTSNNLTACGNTDTVVITVVPDFSLSITPDTLICPNDSLELWVEALPTSNSYSYNWSPDSLVNIDTVSNPRVLPSENSTFKVQVSSSLGCVKNESVNVYLAPPFPKPITLMGVDELCPGDSTQIMVNFGGVDPSNCGTVPYPSNGIQDSVEIGTGTRTNSVFSYPAPYGNYYADVSHQIIYRANELRSMGFKGGLIKSISFNIVLLGNVDYENFSVKIGCTSEDSFFTAPGWITGLETVLPSYTHKPNLGWNKHEFVTPYNWDGVSNLVIELYYENPVSASGGSSLSTHTVTNYHSVWFKSPSNAVTFTSNNRPNIKMNFTDVIDTNSYIINWSPIASMDLSEPLSPIVYPTSSTNYTVTITDVFGKCVDTVSHSLNVVSKYNASFLSNSPYCQNDPIDQFYPVNLGGNFTGPGIDSLGFFNPSISDTGFVVINYNTNSNNSCNNDSDMVIQVLPIPDATITTQEVCSDVGTVILSANTPGGIWSGIGIMDSLTGEFSPAGLPYGFYSMIYKVTTNCTNADTASIKIIEPFSFSWVNPSVNVCQGSTSDLSNNFTMSNSPWQGTGPIVTKWSDVNGYIDSNGVFDASSVSPGNYTVTLSVNDQNGNCAFSNSMFINVSENPIPSSVNDFSFCESQSVARIFVNPWMYGGGMSFSQNPLAPLSFTDTLDFHPYGQNGEFNPTVQGKGKWEIEFTFINQYGCIGKHIDTIYVLESPTGDVTRSGGVLKSLDGQGYTYQWLDCDVFKNPVVGATNQTFSPGVAGSFAVRVNAGECNVESICQETWPTGIQNINDKLGVSIYPNPVDYELQIDKGENKKLNIEITDYSGRVVYSKQAISKITKVNMSELSSGVYFVKMSNDNGSHIEKVVKK